MIDFSPPPLVFPKPAIIRPATADLLKYGGLNLASFLPGMFPAGIVAADARSPIVIDTRPFLSSTATATTYTFSAADIGTAAADRTVLVGVTTGFVTVDSVTIGGNAAAACAANSSQTNGSVRFFALLVPTGTTATIAVTVSASQGRCGVGVWALTGVQDLTATDMAESNADPGVVSVDVLAGGAVFGAAYNSSTASVVWTNLTSAYDATVVSRRMSGASESFAGAVIGQSVTANGGSTGVMQAIALR